MSALQVAAHAWARLGGTSIVRARNAARAAADRRAHGRRAAHAEDAGAAERDELAVLAALGLPDPERLATPGELRAELERTQRALVRLAGEMADTAAVLHLALSLVESQPELLDGARDIVRAAEGGGPIQ